MGTTAEDGPAWLIAALSAALATRSREAFTALLTDDVHWGGEHGGNQCTNKAEAGDHYARLVADGVTIHIADIVGAGDVVTATLQITSPEPDDYPTDVIVRITLRSGLIADITELDPPPHIEVLYFDGCPHYETFRPHLRRLLTDHGINATITLTSIDSDDDAQSRRFLGSPTMRVNGIDVEPAAADRHTYALQCRRYSGPDGITGVPPDQWILDALTDNPDQDALIEAIHNGDTTTLNRMLTERPALATTRLVRHGGRTPLHVATDWPGHFPNVAATITTLIQAGANPDTPALGEHPETPLHWAASSGDLDALNALLDAGADINASGAVIAGGTPLADATAFGEWAAARQLVKRGARANLFEAAALGLTDRVNTILDNEYPTADNITSSFWGACHGGQTATAAILLEHGADINWTGYDDLTPLHAANRAHATELEAWLRQWGATAH